MENITSGNKTYTVIAEAKTNVGALKVFLDNGIVSSWVSRPQIEGGRFKCVSSGPVESYRVWNDLMTKEAAIHHGAWWEDHKAHLMAMTWVALQNLA